MKIRTDPVDSAPFEFYTRTWEWTVSGLRAYSLNGEARIDVMLSGPHGADSFSIPATHPRPALGDRVTVSTTLARVAPSQPNPPTPTSLDTHTNPKGKI